MLVVMANGAGQRLKCWRQRISGTDERVIHAALQRREHLGRIRDQLDELVDRNGLIKRNVLELVDERDRHRSGQQGLVRPDEAPLQGGLVHRVPVLLDVLWPGQADGHHGKQAKGNLHRLWDTVKSETHSVRETALYNSSQTSGRTRPHNPPYPVQ
uniref:Uncharacterized protein n=1 Tax=Anopheles melas TaxID=34690 RepID=A0A182UKZ7_9DIPT